MADSAGNNPARESRPVRPYKGVDVLQDVLDQAVLRLDGEATAVADGSTVITPGDYLLREVVIDFLGVDEESQDPTRTHEEFMTRLEEALSDSGISPDEYGYLTYTLTVSTPYLKLLEKPWEGDHAALKETGGRVFVTTSGRENRPKPLLAPSGGCSIEFIIHLARNRDGKRADHELEVWKKGTWLARIRFGLETDVSDIGFVPTPLTADIKEKLDLPTDTVRYIIAERPLDPEGSPTDLLVYVDEGVLDAIAANLGGSGTKAFQHQLALDVVAAIINESSRALAGEQETTLTSIHESLCHRLIRQASRTAKGRIDEDREEAMFTRLKDEPLRVLAEFEGNRDIIRKQLVASVREAS